MAAPVGLHGPALQRPRCPLGEFDDGWHRDRVSTVARLRLAAACGQRGRHHPVDLQVREQQCHPDDVRDGVVGPDLVEVCPLEVGAVDRRLRRAQPLEHRQRPCLDARREAHLPDDIDHLWVGARRTVPLRVCVVSVVVVVAVVVMVAVVVVPVALVAVFVALVAVLVALVVLVAVFVAAVPAAGLVGQHDVDGGGADSRLRDLAGPVADLERVLDGGQRVAVGPGGEQRPQEHVAAGAHPPVEGERSHGRAEGRPGQEPCRPAPAGDRRRRPSPVS